MPPKFYEHVKQARRLPSDTTNKANIQKTLNDIANRRTNLHHLHSNFEGKPQNFLDNNYLSVLDLQVSMDSSTHDSFTPDNSFILYTTPDITNNDTSNNFYNAVTYQSIDVSSTRLVINKLFLRTHPDNDDNNLRILVNRILYLSLDNDSGYLIKRSDDVSNQSITLFKSGYDSHGKLDNRQLDSMPITSDVSFNSLNLTNNFNNLFPPTKNFGDIKSTFEWTDGIKNNIVDIYDNLDSGNFIVEVIDYETVPDYMNIQDIITGIRISTNSSISNDNGEHFFQVNDTNYEENLDIVQVFLQINGVPKEIINIILSQTTDQDQKQTVIDYVENNSNSTAPVDAGDGLAGDAWGHITIMIQKNDNLFATIGHQKHNDGKFYLLRGLNSPNKLRLLNFKQIQVFKLYGQGAYEHVQSGDDDFANGKNFKTNSKKDYFSLKFAKITFNPELYDIYTHLGVGAHNVLEQDTIGSVNQTTSYINSYGQKVILPNRGVESMSINDSNMRRLIHMDTPNPFAKNLLYTVFDASNAISGVDNSSNPNIDFNVRNWLVSEEDLAPPRGNQVGQFVFTDDAKGEMAYQYFYQSDLSDITIGKKMPYTVFFNISGGKLEFSEQEYQKFAFTGPLIDISSIASAADISKSPLFDLSSLNLNDYIMPSDFSTNFLVFKESYEYRYLAEIAATYFKSNNKFYYKVDGTEPDLSFHYVEWKHNSLDYGSVDKNSDLSLSIIPTHGFFFSSDSNSKYNDSDFKSVLDKFYRHANRMIFANPPDLSSTLYFAYPDYDNATTAAPSYIAVTHSIDNAKFENNTFILTLTGSTNIDIYDGNFSNIRSIIVGKNKILGSQLNNNEYRKLLDNGILNYENIENLQNLESLNLRHLTGIEVLGTASPDEDVSHISTLVIPRTVTGIVDQGLLNDNITLNNLIFLNDVNSVSGIDISMILTDISGRVNTVYFLHPNVNSQTPNIMNDSQSNGIDTGNMKRLFSIPYNNNILKYE